MEIELAEQILEMDTVELSMILEKVNREDHDMYEYIKELVEDVL